MHSRSLLFVALPLLMGAQPAFDVATMKPSDLRTVGSMGLYTYPGGRINVSRLTLQDLIVSAYGIQYYQISGGPGWVNNDRWDVVAQPSPDSEAGRFNPPTIKTPPTPEMLLMLRSLIAERFRLKIHKETKEGAAFALVVGDKGAQLTPTKDPMAFRYTGMGQSGKSSAPWYAAGENASLGMLAQYLADEVKRPVIDQTGIQGNFDYRFEYAKDGESQSGPSFFTAMQEELGLKLVSIRAPVDMWVIDSAERPSEN